MSDREKLYDKITGKILGLLDEGKIPWNKPWNVVDMPTNGKTGNVYDGFNLIFLSMISSFNDWDSVFVGFKQANKLDGKVKKGEKGWPILYPAVVCKDENGDTVSRHKAEQLKAEGKEVEKAVFYNYSHVWNVSQCEGINEDLLHENAKMSRIKFEPIKICQEIVNRWTDRPPVSHRGAKAFYHRGQDEIVLPPRNKFASEEEYYSVLFHEMIHATGSPDRLDRQKGDQFGDKKYSFEELVAEIGSAFLCGFAGIDKQTIENSAGYIQHWKAKLEDDNQLIFKAINQAKKAVGEIVGGKENFEQLNKAKSLKKVA